MKQRGPLKNIRYMMGILWKADKLLVIYTLYKNTTESLFWTFFSVYITKFIYSQIESGGSYAELLLITGGACLLHVVVHFTAAFHGYYLKLATPRVYRYIFTRVIDKTSTIDLASFEKPEFYDKYSRALDECLTRGIDMLHTVSFVMGGIASAIFAVMVFVEVDPILLLFVIPGVIAALVCGRMRSKILYQLEMECTRDKRIADYTKRVFYEKKYASEIRLYGIKKVLIKRHGESFERLYKTNKKFRFKAGAYDLLNRLTMFAFATLAGLLYSAFVVKTGDASLVAAYVVMVNAISHVSYVLMDLIEDSMELPKHDMNISNLRAFFDYKPEEKGGELIPAPTEIEKIEFRNVSFTYTGATVPTIRNLNMTIHKHERIAFVGHNGAGKTTLVKLLMGLYRVSEGEILLNGINIDKFEEKSYHKLFGTVFQDLQIFALPISHNVLMREPENEAERELVRDSLIKAQFGDKLSELPKGIDTMVTKEFDKDGCILSGGQSQKLAIARVFAKNPEIVVLDEPSSALDPIAEYNMYKNMMEASENKAVVFISHRLSSARIADKIYMFENGEVIETGTHDELMEKDGKYAEMFKLQARNYQESLPLEMEAIS